MTQNDLRLCDPGTDNFRVNGAPVFHKTILFLQLTVLQYNAVTLLNSAVSASYELIYNVLLQSNRETVHQSVTYCYNNKSSQLSIVTLYYVVQCVTQFYNTRYYLISMCYH